MARFSREELGEKCEKHIFLQEIAEEVERRARFSGQLRERFTACTEIEEEYRALNAGTDIEEVYGCTEIDERYDLHLMLYGCIYCCTAALIFAQKSRRLRLH